VFYPGGKSWLRAHGIFFAADFPSSRAGPPSAHAKSLDFTSYFNDCSELLQGIRRCIATINRCLFVMQALACLRSVKAGPRTIGSWKGVSLARPFWWYENSLWRPLKMPPVPGAALSIGLRTSPRIRAGCRSNASADDDRAWRRLGGGPHVRSENQRVKFA
jgi:hypothetical protein